jgi:hypothetical protein
MKPVRVVRACLLAAVALGAVGVATASAEAPEFGRCLKKAEPSLPGYSDSKCTKAATEAKNGKYEWVPGAVPGKNGFEIAGGVLTWATKAGQTMTCTSMKGEGEYSLTNNKRWSGVVLEVAGCTHGFGGVPCTTTGRASGELVFNELEAEVGYEDLSKKTTALKLYPASSAGDKFITFKCGTLSVDLRGKGGEAGAGVLVNINNNKMTASELLKFKATKAVQQPVIWEGLPEETYLEQSFESLGYEQAGWTVTWSVTNDEAMKYELNLLV